MKEYTSLDSAVKALKGGDVKIENRYSVSGGDINRAFSLSLSDGSKLFMKSNSKRNIAFFRAEVSGLNAIKSTAAIRTPEALALGCDGDSAFLILELIEGRGRRPGFFEDFGRKLAAFHSAPCDDFVINGKYGFTEDNYIGAGFQKNTPKNSWIDFFRECRLEPQIERASACFDDGDRRMLISLLDKLDRLLYEPSRPSLLHGDLWGGNYMSDGNGEAVLIDPAAYVGCNEADIAMTELFGGYDRAFYSSYRDAIYETVPGYEDRRDLYNLYHLLNHLNLFGGGYLSSVREIIRRYA